MLCEEAFVESPESAYEAREIIEQLLRSGPGKARALDILYRHEVEGETYREIGQRYDLSAGHVQRLCQSPYPNGIGTANLLRWITHREHIDWRRSIAASRVPPRVQPARASVPKSPCQPKSVKPHAVKVIAPSPLPTSRPTPHPRKHTKPVNLTPEYLPIAEADWIPAYREALKTMKRKCRRKYGGKLCRDMREWADNPRPSKFFRYGHKPCDLDIPEYRLYGDEIIEFIAKRAMKGLAH
jgi:hypothetical protein